MDGILNIYKEPGYTSFDVVARLRGILHQKKIGHTGTLDPMAEGVLLVCLGKATKLVDILTSKDKHYEAVVRLGFETDTEDITGKIISPDIYDAGYLSDKLSCEDIKKAVLSYVGSYMQIPPMYSAIKKDGKKLYEYARKGREIEREPREVFIYSIENMDISVPDIRFYVHCSKGTYIRSLARDIGKSLGVGATLAKLKRSSVNDYTADTALTLDKVEALSKEDKLSDYIIPIDKFLSMYKRLDVTGAGINFIKNGNKLAKNMVSNYVAKPDEIFRIYLDDEFMALYQYIGQERILKPYKMFL